jgi:hypothetical protein
MPERYVEAGDPTAIIVDAAIPPKSTQYKVNFPVVLRVSLDALKSQNDIVSVENPFGHTTFIIDAIIDVKVIGTDASAVVDVDITTSDSATGDDIFDGIDITALTKVSMSEAGAGTNAEHTGQKWDKVGGTNAFVNAKLLAANGTAFEGDLYLVCVPCND